MRACTARSMVQLFRSVAYRMFACITSHIHLRLRISIRPRVLLAPAGWGGSLCVITSLLTPIFADPKSARDLPQSSSSLYVTHACRLPSLPGDNRISACRRAVCSCAGDLYIPYIVRVFVSHQLRMRGVWRPTRPAPSRSSRTRSVPGSGFFRKRGRIEAAPEGAASAALSGLLCDGSSRKNRNPDARAARARPFRSDSSSPCTPKIRAARLPRITRGASCCMCWSARTADCWHHPLRFCVSAGMATGGALRMDCAAVLLAAPLPLLNCTTILLSYCMHAACATSPHAPHARCRRVLILLCSKVTS